jgi:hypothetical protein
MPAPTLFDCCPHGLQPDVKFNRSEEPFSLHQPSNVIITMGYSLFFKKERPTAPYHEDQSLGQRIGRVDIRCTLKANASHWTKSTNYLEIAEITGLLHFNIEFRADASVPLRSASVQIDVGEGVNKEPVPTIKAYAPLSAISGAQVRQHIVDTTRTDPHLAVTTPYGRRRKCILT